MIERVRIGTERHVSVRLDAGTYSDGDHGVVLHEPHLVDSVERFEYQYPELQLNPGWRHARYDWGTARPVKAPKISVSVKIGDGTEHELVSIGFWKRVWLWLTFRSQPRIPRMIARETRSITDGAGE